MNKKLMYVVMLLALVAGVVLVPASVSGAAGRVAPVLPAGDEAVVAASSSVVIPAVVPVAPIIYVRPAGSDTLCDGTSNMDYSAAYPTGTACAFKTIQKGVNSVASGGTVHVAAGTYLESDIAIHWPLTLSGAGEGSTRIGPAVADSQVCTSGLATGNHHGILIKSSDVTVQDLTVDGSLNNVLGPLNYHMGITTDYLTATYNNITVMDVTVKNVWFRGVVVRAKQGEIGAGDLIDHVSVQNVGGCNTSATDRQAVWGIILHAASGEIRNSSVSASGHGIATGNTTGTQTDVDVHDNTVSSIDCQQYTLVHNGAGSSFFNNVGNAGGTWANECATGLVTYYSELSVRASTFTGAPWGVYVGFQNMAVDKLVLGPNFKVIGPGAAFAGSIGVQSDGAAFWTSTNRFTMGGATVQGFETGIQVGNLVPPNTTVADVKNSVITGNGTGVLVNDGATLTVHNSDLSGNTPTGVNNARTDQTAPVDATANWWGSASCPVSPYIVGNVAVGTCAAALVTGPTMSTHEIGEAGTLDTKVTATGLYGVQFVVNHTPSVLTFAGGTKHNAGTGDYDWDWTKTYPGKDFAVGFPATGQTTLAATLRNDTHPYPATLVDGKLATWKYTCTGVGTSPLVYDTSVGTGSYLSDKNGFPIPAVWLGDSITCVAATGSVEGNIQLQGRLGTNSHYASWYGAEVTLTCASSACAGYGPYTMTTDDLGYYQWAKAGVGTGIAVGEYTVTVTRRAYLSATKTANVTIVADTTTTVAPTPTLLGGDVNATPGVELGDLTAIGGLFGTLITADTGPDVNGDGYVNIFDLVLAGGNYGRTAPQAW